MHVKGITFYFDGFHPPKLQSMLLWKILLQSSRLEEGGLEPQPIACIDAFTVPDFSARLGMYMSSCFSIKICMIIVSSHHSFPTKKHPIPTS